MLHNELVINITFYTDPVFNVELFLAKQRLFWVPKVKKFAKQFSLGIFNEQHLQCCYVGYYLIRLSEIGVAMLELIGLCFLNSRL